MCLSHLDIFRDNEQEEMVRCESMQIQDPVLWQNFIDVPGDNGEK